MSYTCNLLILKCCAQWVWLWRKNKTTTKSLEQKLKNKRRTAPFTIALLINYFNQKTTFKKQINEIIIPAVHCYPHNVSFARQVLSDLALRQHNWTGNNGHFATCIFRDYFKRIYKKTSELEC